MGFVAEVLEAFTRVAPGRRGKAKMRVQTLIFSKDHWTEAKAKRWAKTHGFKYGKVDEKSTSFRLRQVPPEEFRVLRTIEFGDETGIKAVVGR